MLPADAAAEGPNPCEMAGGWTLTSSRVGHGVLRGGLTPCSESCSCKDETLGHWRIPFPTPLDCFWPENADSAKRANSLLWSAYG